MLGQPIELADGPAMHGSGTVASAHNGGYGDDDDVDEQMFAIARMARIGQRFKIAANRTDLHELGHESLPCEERTPAPASQTRLAASVPSRKDIDSTA